jgi:hypothetical protein
MQAPAPDAIEVLMTLSLSQYAEMGHDLDIVRQRLDLPISAPSDEVIRKALRLLASDG